MNYIKITTILALGLLFSCTTKSDHKDENKEVKEEIKMEFQNKGHELIYALVQATGDYSKLASKKNVVYTYTYSTADGKADISTEKYIFHNELSYGKYAQHERTLADLEGEMEQGYNGREYWLKIDGKEVTDEKALKMVAFNRPTNFYWFAMMQKLMDPGINYEYVGESSIGDKSYDLVKVSFTSEGDKPTDIYQLFINKETHLADQFLFTVADFGVIDSPMLMEVEYEKVEDLLIPTKRRYKMSTWDALVSDKPWTDVTWTNIKFDQDITTEVFEK